MTDIDKAIARARALEAAALPAPWRWQFAHPGYLLGSYATTDKDHVIRCVLDGTFDPQDLNDCNVAAMEGDRDLIAHARNTHKLVWDVVEAANKLPDYRNTNYSERRWRKFEDALDALARATLGQTEGDEVTGGE